MDILTATVQRLNQLIAQQGTNPNALSNKAGVPQATVKSILNGESQNPGIVTLKKIVDGFDNPPITFPEFFDDDIFHALEQEIQ